jgi:hypothetical protein
MGLWGLLRKRKRRNAFSRLESQDLDLLMLPQYTPPAEEQTKQRRAVEQILEEAGRESFDAGTREFLNNYINAMADKSVAELRGQRDDALAIADAYIALAVEKVAQFESPYLADLARVAQAANALAVTFEELTGRQADQFVSPNPRRVTEGPLISTLGPIDISDDTSIHVDADETPPETAGDVLDDLPDPHADPPTPQRRASGTNGASANHHRSHDDDQ